MSDRKRAGVNVIIPWRLMQRGQFLTWPAKQKKSLLDFMKVTVVVNLWHKIDPDLSPEDTDRLYINWHISPSELPKNADLMVYTLTTLMKRGEIVLVHCEAGKGRSVWLCARLLAAYNNTSTVEAWRDIQALVPSHSVHGPLLEDLHRL